MSVKPISPNEVAEAKMKLPQAVIKAFNECIAFHYVNGCSEFTQEEVLEKIIDLYSEDEGEITVKSTREEIRRMAFQKGWLNIEALYQKEGWNVYYDKPGYNESYLARFEFSKNS